MMKRILILVSLLGISVMLTSCGEPIKLQHDGETWDKDELAEHLENELELENSGMDLDIGILVENEDD